MQVPAIFRNFLAASIAMFALVSSSASFAQANVHELFAASHKRIVVIAHRGCHDPAPDHGFGYSPENSLTALEHCVAMGVDMMEIDIRLSADRALVIMHDDTVDRTTNGHGEIAQLTLATIRRLRLRQNLGGYAEPLTDQRVLTLDEVLRAAKGRIALNLDVKASIYAEVVDAVKKANATNFVTIKTGAGANSPALAAIEPFEQVAFIPILNGNDSDLITVAKRQTNDANPLAFELPHTPVSNLSAIAQFAKEHSMKLIVNTLGDGFLSGLGGDNDALKNPDAIWGWLQRNGVSVIQTDRPEALLKFCRRPQ